MNRLSLVKQRTNDIGKMIQRALYNRADDNDIDWNESDDIRKTLEKLANTNTIAICSGDELNIECETGYFFISIGEKMYIENIEEKLKEKVYNLAECNEGFKKKSKIVVMFLVNNMETRAYLENIANSQKTDLQKMIKECIKIKPKIEYLFLVSHKNVCENIEINGIDRYDTIQEPRLYNNINFSTKIQENKQMGYVTTVQLLELVELYNKIGDKLFDNNVRYGISEKLGVDKAIVKTLEKDGDQFWYRNNGITILVKSNNFKLSNPNKIVFKKNENFSVINGAQTITAAANYYYAILSKKENGGENCDAIINSIKKARVLLRIICINDAGIENPAKSIGNEISVALNRQKPIKVEDIAYTIDYISGLLDILNDENIGKKAKFKLNKRGENISSEGMMDLVEFSRARLACIDRPVEARNGSASKFLKNDNIKFLNDDIFPVLENIDDFKKNFNAIRFAHDISVCYNKAKKGIIPQKVELMTEKDDKKKTLINNAKWYMIAHLIKELNKSNQKNDFSKFDFGIDDINITNGINEYFTQATEFTDTPITLDTFKTNEWYKKMEQKIDMQKVVKAFLNKDRSIHN